MQGFLIFTLIVAIIVATIKSISNLNTPTLIPSRRSPEKMGQKKSVKEPVLQTVEYQDAVDNF
jgi:hypothetical protein